jgi:hypothetical protein
MFSLLQVTIAALVAFLMGTVSASPARAEKQVRTLRVSTFKGQPYCVAAYFLSKVAPPNIKIDIVEMATSSEALDAVLTGDTDAAYLGLITCVLGVARDRPIAAVASVGRKGTRIVARKSQTNNHLMERTQLFDPMGELKLYGMKTTFDEIIAIASSAVLARRPRPYSTLLRIARDAVETESR